MTTVQNLRRAVPEPMIGGSMGRPRVRPKLKGKTYRERFILRLFDLAEASGLDNAAIAKAVGVSTVAVAKWLQGRNTPELDYWPALAKALGIAAGDLPPKS